MSPLFVQINPSDNVGIIVNPEGVGMGAEFSNGLQAKELIPQSHKIALKRIASGEPILRYGFVIGYANRDIETGTWVRENLLDMPAPPPLESLPLATDIPPSLPPLDGCTFQGFRNNDGSAGTRNVFGITTTVQCVAPTVDYAVRRIRDEILPRYPNVDDVVALTHSYGCGIAIDAPGAAIPIRTLKFITQNANIVTEPLIVSLGCEKMQPIRILDTGSGKNEPGIQNSSSERIIRCQDELGFNAGVSAIMRAAENRLEKLNGRKRETCPASDLVVGLQCGGSDAFSGVTCNPAVGYAADLLVRAGATVMFSEVTEVRDAVHLLTPRAATRQVALDLIREMRWYDDYLRNGGADRSANTTPGNKRGGLVEHCREIIGIGRQGGNNRVAGGRYTWRASDDEGSGFAATPASDFICGTQQLASMNLHVFTTGEGSPYGLSLVPVVKVSSRTALAEKWPDLIDFDAGPIATGQATIAETGWKLFQFILDTASGRKTWAEHWKLGNTLSPFNPGPVT